MKERKLERIRRRIKILRLRAGNVRHGELASLANSLGRKRDYSRGKEPTFTNRAKGWIPLSIPDHPGALKKGTTLRILQILEEDLFELERERQR